MWMGIREKIMKIKECIKKKIVLPKGQKFCRIVFLGDIHYGNKTCAVKELEENIAWCLSEQDVYIFTVGDLIECATLSSVGLYDQSIKIGDQINYVYNLLKPFADQGRLIGMLQGNHEKRLWKLSGYDITKDLATRLGVPYGYRGTFIYLNVYEKESRRGQNYVLYGTHGSSGSWTTGGKVNACERMLYAVEAELYFMGHVHELLHIKIPRKRVDRGFIQNFDTHFILTGGYLRYWQSYAQEKGYPPTSIGSPKVKFHADKHRISVSV